MSYVPNSPNAVQQSADLLSVPRGIVSIDGIAVDTWEIIVTNNSFYVADTYQVSLPIHGQPPKFNFSEFVKKSGNFTLKIYLGIPPNQNNYNTSDLQLVIIGESNQVKINPISGSIVISGRDLSSRLIDNKITEGFPDSTLSQLASMFAESNKLKQRITPTTEVLGNFYESGQTYLGNNTTQWDLLTSAAQYQDFVIFVENDTLVCEPRPPANGSNNPFVFTYTPPNANSASPMFGGETLEFTQNGKISGNVSVTVKVPYDTETGDAFFATASSHSRSRSTFARRDTYVIAGLTEAQAQQRANQILKDLTMHGTEVEIECPVNNAIKKDRLIQITGFGNALDDFYYPESIVRTMTFDKYVMRVSAKNKSSQTQYTPEFEDPEGQPEDAN